MKIRSIFIGFLLFSLKLFSEDVWIVNPRITAMGGIQFATFDRDYSPNMWDISGIKAGRVFDLNSISQIKIETCGSSKSVTTQDTIFSIYDGDTVERIHSFEVEEMDQGMADVFISPKGNFYFGARTFVKENWAIDRQVEFPGFVKSYKKNITYEGYTGWEKENLSLCISIGSFESKRIGQNSSSFDIEGSFALFISPSFHCGFLQRYSKGRYIHYQTEWSGEVYTHEKTKNTSYNKFYFDWTRPQKSIMGICLGTSRAIDVEQPYDYAAFRFYEPEEFSLFYNEIFHIKDFELNLSISNLIRFNINNDEISELFDPAGLKLEMGVNWKEKIICMQFDPNGDFRFGTEFGIYKIRIRTGYLYEGSMDDWIDLSPHIFSGGVGIPIGKNSIIDFAVKEMYGIFIAGASARMNL